MERSQLLIGCVVQANSRLGFRPAVCESQGFELSNFHFVGVLRRTQAYLHTPPDFAIGYLTGEYEEVSALQYKAMIYFEGGHVALVKGPE
jgi:hypothetical protein